MSPSAPHFLLLTGTHRSADREEWQFILQAADGSATLTAQEAEADYQGERLELLSVVRGLEALEQPSRVTLVTRSSYVRRGIRQGLEEWRRNGWTWESFGEMVPVKNCDLWQRFDRAASYHRIEVRQYRFDQAHGQATDTASAIESQRAPWPTPGTQPETAVAPRISRRKDQPHRQVQPSNQPVEERESGGARRAPGWLAEQVERGKATLRRVLVGCLAATWLG